MWSRSTLRSAHRPIYAGRDIVDHPDIAAVRFGSHDRPAAPVSARSAAAPLQRLSGSYSPGPPLSGGRNQSPITCPAQKRVPRRLEWMSMPGLEGSDYRQNGFASACVSVERTGPQVSSVEALDWDPLIAVVTHAHALALALANPFRRTKGARPTVGSHPRRTARNQKKGAGRPSARPHTAPQPYLRAASARPDPLCRPHTDRWRGAQ
jgi:hypothetical protein